jgi:hypothetical protein
MSTPAALQFPHSRVLLARTRLAYVHLRNLLTDAKRDRAARISGYVAVSQLDELLLFYLLNGEVANATLADPRGSRAIPIASALEMVPHEPEYGECCLHEAEPDELACIFASQTAKPDPWPAGMNASDATVLFPYLASTTFDGFIEIVANDHVNYLVLENGAVARAFLATEALGTIIERVAKIFSREGRIGDLRVKRWAPPAPLPAQAPHALVQAYRDLVCTLVKRIADRGQEDAPTVAERARQMLVATHPALDAFSISGGRKVADPVADTRELTCGVAAWIREVLWTAKDADDAPPEDLFRELTYERRHIFQSAGLFDQMPWKVV